MDIYAALMGEAPTDEEKLRALAAQLRAQKSLGAIGLATGDRGLAPAGKDLASSADEYAKLVQQTRQDALQRAELGQWRQMQTQTARGNNLMDYQAALEAAAARRAAAADAASARQDRNEDKQRAQNDRMTAQFSNRLQSAGLPALQVSINRVNGLMMPYVEKGKSLPGIGGVKNTVLGRALLSDDGKLMQSSVQGVVNDLMKLYSGQAVTDPETVRRLREMSLTMFDSPENFANMWGFVTDRFNNVKNSIRGGYDPSVQQAFRENGGMGLEDLTDVTKSHVKSTLKSNDIDAQIEALKKELEGK